jgi:hypothetical protein
MERPTTSPSSKPSGIVLRWARKPGSLREKKCRWAPIPTTTRRRRPGDWREDRPRPDVERVTEVTMAMTATGPSWASHDAVSPISASATRRAPAAVSITLPAAVRADAEVAQG